MTPGERWLAATWPLVHARLPAAPARVLEVGCGSLGGFIPMLRADGYDALGIDPQAPDEAHYQRIEFELADLPRQVDAVVASTSLHHVADPALVIDRITGTLASGGTVVVVEWAWEKFDETTARWCFQRLGQDDEANWLHQLRDEWTTSAEVYLPVTVPGSLQRNRTLAATYTRIHSESGSPRVTTAADGGTSSPAM